MILGEYNEQEDTQINTSTPTIMYETRNVTK
jgi:hypothetical protein